MLNLILQKYPGHLVGGETTAQKPSRILCRASRLFGMECSPLYAPSECDCDGSSGDLHPPSSPWGALHRITRPFLFYAEPPPGEWRPNEPPQVSCTVSLMKHRGVSRSGESGGKSRAKKRPPYSMHSLPPRLHGQTNATARKSVRF